MVSTSGAGASSSDSPPLSEGSGASVTSLPPSEGSASSSTGCSSTSSSAGVELLFTGAVVSVLGALTGVLSTATHPPRASATVAAITGSASVFLVFMSLPLPNHARADPRQDLVLGDDESADNEADGEGDPPGGQQADAEGDGGAQRHEGQRVGQREQDQLQQRGLRDGHLDLVIDAAQRGLGEGQVVIMLRRGQAEYPRLEHVADQGDEEDRHAGGGHLGKTGKGQLPGDDGQARRDQQGDQDVPALVSADGVVDVDLGVDVCSAVVGGHGLFS